MSIEEIQASVEEFTSDAAAVLKRHNDEIASLKAEIAGWDDRPAPPGPGRLVQPDPLGEAILGSHGGQQDSPRPRARARVLGPAGRDSNTLGFHGFGDFAMAVKNAGSPGGEVDGRLMAAAASPFPPTSVRRSWKRLLTRILCSAELCRFLWLATRLPFQRR